MPCLLSRGASRHAVLIWRASATHRMGFPFRCIRGGPARAFGLPHSRVVSLKGGRESEAGRTCVAAVQRSKSEARIRNQRVPRSQARRLPSAIAIRIRLGETPVIRAISGTVKSLSFAMRRGCEARPFAARGRDSKRCGDSDCPRNMAKKANRDSHCPR